MQLKPVEGAFAADIDYAMLVKLCGNEPEKETRYSPASCLGTEQQIVQGNPDTKHISTSHVERQNLTMRRSMRRFTRLTNGFTKKMENLEYAVAIYYMYYKFARVHRTLGITPAMAAGVADHIWTLGEIVALSD